MAAGLWGALMPAPRRVATEAGRVCRRPVPARLARAADLVGPANSARPVLRGTAEAGTAPVRTAAPGTAGAGKMEVAAAGERQVDTAQLAVRGPGLVARSAICRLARNPAVTVPPATPAGPAARDRAAVLPAGPDNPVAPGRPASARPAAWVGIAGWGRSSGRAVDRFGGADRHSRHPASWANPVGHVAPWVIQVPAHPGSTAGPASQSSDPTSAIPAAGQGRHPAAWVAPAWGSVESGRPRCLADAAAANRGNPRAARLNSQLLPTSTDNDAGQNLGCPDCVKYQNAELNQTTVKITASSPPSTGSTQPGRPRNRKDSILAAKAP